MGMLIRHLKKANKQNAQGLAEFALVLPLFLLLVFGVIEIGWLVYNYSAVFTASRDAARYGSGAGTSTTSGTVYALDCAGIRNRAKKTAVSIGLTDANISIYYDSGPNSSGNSVSLGHCDCPASEKLVSGETSCTVYGQAPLLGYRVNVIVNKTINLVFPVLKNTTIPISSTSHRTVISGVVISGNQAVVVTTVVTTIVDVCPNLDGVQASIPSGDILYGGQCVPYCAYNNTIPASSSSCVYSTPTLPSNQNCSNIGYGSTVYYSGNTINIYIQNSSASDRAVSNIEIWWSGTPTLNNIVFESQKSGTSTVWGGTGFANTSPTNVAISFPFLNWDYTWVRFNYNQNASSANVTFVKFTFADGCYVVWGSHS